MSPADFRALSKSQRLEELADTLASLANSLATRQEAMLACGLSTGWSSASVDHYRTLVAASAVFTQALAVGRACQVSRRELPGWVVDLVGQASGNWLAAPRAPVPKEAAHVDAV
jgi:hypothetical protein